MAGHRVYSGVNAVFSHTISVSVALCVGIALR